MNQDDKFRSPGKLVTGMQLIYSRVIPFIDVQSLASGDAREALFRDERDELIFYLSNGERSAAVEERIIRLGPREALIWLNETAEEGGAFWN